MKMAYWYESLESLKWSYCGRHTHRVRVRGSPRNHVSRRARELVVCDVEGGGRRGLARRGLDSHHVLERRARAWRRDLGSREGMADKGRGGRRKLNGLRDGVGCSGLKMVYWYESLESL